MSTKWVADTRSAIFTIVRKNILDKYIEEYPDLYFTRKENNDELETNMYPACYFHFSYVERGNDLTNDGINAILMMITVDITASESQGVEVAEEIAFAILDELKAMNFNVTMIPETITLDSNVERVIFKCERIIGFNDVLFTS